MSARCSVCPKADTTGRIYEYRPELDAARRSRALAGQAPLHRHHAAGVPAAHDDAEIGTGLIERRRIDVGLGGGRLDVGHRLGATCELVLEKALRALAGFGLRWGSRGLRRASAARPSRALIAAADAGDPRDAVSEAFGLARSAASARSRASVGGTALIFRPRGSPWPLTRRPGLGAAPTCAASALSQAQRSAEWSTPG